MLLERDGQMEVNILLVSQLLIITFHVQAFRPPLRESCLEYTFDFRAKGRKIGKQFMK